jgi:uncharacterized integral membrane protein
MTDPGQPTKRQDDIPWRLIVLGLVGLYVILFLVLNLKTVEVSFVFFSMRASLIVALIVAAVAGFIGGWLAKHLRSGDKS